MSTIDINVENLEISSLSPYAGNARTHSDDQVRMIAESIRVFGFINPVLINDAGGIIAGHGRVMAAQQLGLSVVPCIRLRHLNESQRRAYILADNQLALRSSWDEEKLAGELAALAEFDFDLGVLGFSDRDLDRLLTESAASGAPRGNDEWRAPDTEKPALSRAGDIWVMGGHRLLCADCLDVETLPRLLAGEAVDVVWTDPPYNVSYETAAGKVHNDSQSDGEFLRFLHGAFKAMFAVMRPGSSVYIAHADTEGYNFRRAFRDAGFKLSGVVIWKKNALVLGRSDYQWMHEPVLYGWKPGKAHRWYGGRKQTTVVEMAEASPFVMRTDGMWEINLGDRLFIVDGNARIEELVPSVMREDRPSKSDLHPTMKPVQLVMRQLQNSAKVGDIVLDPFAGSGSTLIAAERLGMRARLVELSPHYCDSIVGRWEGFTGLQALHDGSGLSPLQLAAARGAEANTGGPDG